MVCCTGRRQLSDGGVGVERIRASPYEDPGGPLGRLTAAQVGGQLLFDRQDTLQLVDLTGDRLQIENLLTFMCRWFERPVG